MTPRRTIAAGVAPVTSSPSTRTRPDGGRITPHTAFSSELLPAPFGPINATRSPRAERSDTPSTATACAVPDDQLLDLEQARSQRRRPEIRLDDALVLAHLGRRPVRDHPAAVEHDHAVGDRPDELHVVLDEHLRQPARP